MPEEEPQASWTVSEEVIIRAETVQPLAQWRVGSALRGEGRYAARRIISE